MFANFYIFVDELLELPVGLSRLHCECQHPLSICTWCTVL